MTVTHLCAPLFIFVSSIGIDFSELSLNLFLSTSCMLAFGFCWIMITSFIIWPILHFRYFDTLRNNNRIFPASKYNRVYFYVASTGMTFSMTVLFVSTICPKWAEHSVQELNHVQGRNRDAQIILKLEQLCSSWLSYIMAEFMIRYTPIYSTNMEEIEGNGKFLGK